MCRSPPCLNPPWDLFLIPRLTCQKWGTASHPTPTPKVSPFVDLPPHFPFPQTGNSCLVLEVRSPALTCRIPPKSMVSYAKSCFGFPKNLGFGNRSRGQGEVTCLSQSSTVPTEQPSGSNGEGSQETKDIPGGKNYQLTFQKYHPASQALNTHESTYYL